MSTQRYGYYALKKEIVNIEEQQTECADQIEYLKQRNDTLKRQLSQAYDKYDRAAITSEKKEAIVWAKRIEQLEDALQAVRTDLKTAEQERNEIDDRLLELRKQIFVASFKRLAPQKREEILRELSGAL